MKLKNLLCLFGLFVFAFYSNVANAITPVAPYIQYTNDTVDTTCLYNDGIILSLGAMGPQSPYFPRLATVLGFRLPAACALTKTVTLDLTSIYAPKLVNITKWTEMAREEK